MVADEIYWISHNIINATSTAKKYSHVWAIKDNRKKIISVALITLDNGEKANI